MSDAVLRAHLGRILDWEDAHASFERAIEGLPTRLRGVTPAGWAHSAWQLLEHLRICQHDILDFCRNPKYVEMAMEDYWPPSAAPPSAKAWSASVAAVRRDRTALKKLAADGKTDLFARIPVSYTHLTLPTIYSV